MICSMTGQIAFSAFTMGACFPTESYFVLRTHMESFWNGEKQWNFVELALVGAEVQRMQCPQDLAYSERKYLLEEAVTRGP